MKPNLNENRNLGNEALKELIRKREEKQARKARENLVEPEVTQIIETNETEETQVTPVTEPIEQEPISDIVTETIEQEPVADTVTETIEQEPIVDTKSIIQDLVEDENPEEGRPEYPEGYGVQGEKLDLKGTVIEEIFPDEEPSESGEEESDEESDDFDYIEEKPTNKKKWIAFIIVVFALGGLGGWMYAAHQDKAKEPEQIEQKQEAPKQEEPKQELSYNDKLKEDLEKKANSSGLPHKVSMTTVGGGYILGSTVYHPDEPTKLYTDFELFTPETKQEVATDATAKKIKAEFEKNLPKLGDTIEVKDKSKITLETYKMSDNTYQTIALYDGKPFAYIVTDKDGHHTNNVTSYYISEVAK